MGLTILTQRNVVLNYLYNDAQRPSAMVTTVSLFFHVSLGPTTRLIT